MKNYIYGISEEKYTLGNESRTSYGIVAFADTEASGTAIIVFKQDFRTTQRKVF